eukprot:scaffold14177_cov124-Isochrysis_galbana.AAC.3
MRRHPVQTGRLVNLMGLRVRHARVRAGIVAFLALFQHALQLVRQRLLGLHRPADHGGRSCRRGREAGAEVLCEAISDDPNLDHGPSVMKNGLSVLLLCTPVHPQESQSLALG